jgi:hypothetical protein
VKPLGKVDQDVSPVFVAPEPRKLVSHRAADETRPDDALEAIVIELAEARGELFQ